MVPTKTALDVDAAPLLFADAGAPTVLGTLSLP
jgi:hypothetical protein